MLIVIVRVHAALLIFAVRGKIMGHAQLRGAHVVNRSVLLLVAVLANGTVVPVQQRVALVPPVFPPPPQLVLQRQLLPCVFVRKLPAEYPAEAIRKLRRVLR